MPTTLQPYSSVTLHALRILCLLMLLPGVSSAEVYKCYDERTGKTSYTDTACPDKEAGDHVPLSEAKTKSRYASQEELRAISERRIQAAEDLKRSGEKVEQNRATKETDETEGQQ